MNLTKGLGAGAKHDIGQAAADESLNEIVNYIQGSNMIFITSGMGGGTGTGASHNCKGSQGAQHFNCGVTTLPFSYEGPKRMRRAIAGLEELKKHLDTVIVVPNQNLFKIANEGTTLKEAFKLSNDVLKHGVQSVTDLMVRPGMVNLDFADVETVMSKMGKAMMGTGEAEGDNRAKVATEIALNNPLIDEYSLKGAKGLLVNITGGDDVTLFEVDQVVNTIRAEVDPEAELIFGAIQDDELKGKIRVSIVATALDGHKSENKTVLNMVNRVINRYNSYSDSLFSRNNTPENITLNLIDGATALKLEDEVHMEKDPEQNIKSESIDNLDYEKIPSGLSLENTSYMEKNNTHQIDETNLTNDKFINDYNSSNNDEELENINPPKIFTDGSSDINESHVDNIKNEEDLSAGNLFDEENNIEEDDFEIPAFLRKQKY